ncbi:GLPGLI family protein [Hymenobacter endophyticus]|uniref:GLPGLI family protein n=1 Tax=Hymenobacter endophyticus TaxID=3076335 RepID=A0ABU3TJZ0_9BACT|nr:GLPGLI family protein [Hymenobacter endophyticus]MDU0371675.1 GLPGLI family protein [Hymenobacter endophyticus]
MTSVINSDYSKFESKNSHLADSIVFSPSFDQSSLNALASHNTTFTYKIYKYNNNIIFYFDKIDQKIFKIKQDNIPMKWTILPEKRIISGYSCQKATTEYGGRKWQAWFSKEIPTPDGPYKFSGLPGLIIEVAAIKRSYNFQLIKLKEAGYNGRPDLPVNAIETSLSQYIKAKSDYFYNGVGQMTKRNSPNNYNKEMEEYKQKQAKKNDLIELKY